MEPSSLEAWREAPIWRLPSTRRRLARWACLTSKDDDEVETARAEGTARKAARLAWRRNTILMKTSDGVGGWGGAGRAEEGEGGPESRAWGLWVASVACRLRARARWGPRSLARGPRKTPPAAPQRQPPARALLPPIAPSWAGRTTTGWRVRRRETEAHAKSSLRLGIYRLRVRLVGGLLGRLWIAQWCAGLRARTTCQAI